MMNTDMSAKYTRAFMALWLAFGAIGVIVALFAPPRSWAVWFAACFALIALSASASYMVARLEDEFDWTTLSSKSPAVRPSDTVAAWATFFFFIPFATLVVLLLFLQLHSVFYGLANIIGGSLLAYYTEVGVVLEWLTYPCISVVMVGGLSGLGTSLSAGICLFNERGVDVHAE